MAILTGGIGTSEPPEMASFRNIIYGTLLVIVLVVRPEGLVSREMIDRVSLKFKHLPGQNGELAGA